MPVRRSQPLGVIRFKEPVALKPFTPAAGVGIASQKPRLDLIVTPRSKASTMLGASGAGNREIGQGGRGLIAASYFIRQGG
jgi:hypothetical protein